ncbi:MAG: M56 family metallopeptidase [Erysipelotrichaceae bacterium]|nr:M56 family metallopeptidase [Erysipelotrichaceae bacterium]
MNVMILDVLSVSLSMSAAILVLALMRKHINKKYSARVMCMIWLFVALRLLIPVEIDLPVSKVNLELNMDQIITEVDLPAIETPEFNNTIQLDQTIKVEETVMPSANFSISWQDAVTWVWIAGAVFMLVKQVLAYCSISKWLKRNSVYEKTVGGFKVYLSSALPEPLSFGIIKSSIYLTEQFKNDNWVLNHELMHCQHYDGLMMWIAALVKSIHWFNPLVYYIDKQWEADRELYCDEAVLKDKTKSERIEYMMTLYDAAEAMNEQKLRFASGLLDGEHQMVERFKMIRMDKIKKTGVLFMSVLCVLIVVGSNLVGCAPEVADNQEKILLMEIVEHVESRGGSISATIFEEKEYIENEDGIQVLDHARAYGSTAYMYSREGMHFCETAVSKYQRYNELIDSLKKMNVVKINDFQINPEINISAKVNVNTDDGYVESLWFYDDGTMRASSGPEYGKREAEFYKVNDDVMEKLIDYVYQDFVEYWSSGKGLERIKEDPSIVDTWPYSLVVNCSEE